MYGDTQVIRALARSMRHQAHHIERETDELLRAAWSAPWTGRAAEAMRSCVGRDAEALRRTATLHFEAAAALEQHAEEVDHLKHLIAAIERAVLAIIQRARERLHGLVGAVGSVVGAVLPDPVDEFWDRFDPPPSGHRDWLTVHLPFPVPGLPFTQLVDGVRS